MTMRPCAGNTARKAAEVSTFSQHVGLRRQHRRDHVECLDHRQVASKSRASDQAGNPAEARKIALNPPGYTGADHLDGDGLRVMGRSPAHDRDAATRDGKVREDCKDVGQRAAQSRLDGGSRSSRRQRSGAVLQPHQRLKKGLRKQIDPVAEHLPNFD